MLIQWSLDMDWRKTFIHVLHECLMAYRMKRGGSGSYLNVARSPVRHEPYRSSGEAQIGRMLKRYDIPALYEFPTRVSDRGMNRIWHPDFTLPVAELIIEYAGMPDLHDYRLGMDHKQYVYGSNGLRALFIQPDDIGGSAWPERLLERLCRASLYPPVPYRGQVQLKTG